MEISFDRLYTKKFAKISEQNLSNPFSDVIWLSKKLKIIKIWQLKVGQNNDLVCYRKNWSFRQCALGLRQNKSSVLYPKGGAKGILEESDNFNSLRPILFELYKKKYRGASRIRVKFGVSFYY